ncbi:MAG: HNH endonuclease, partial [Treponema sp.]|nr:HNH endonuclease [Treponema sp.]
ASLAVEKQKKSGTWRTQEIIDRVSADFKHKCYICESQKPNTINVEHFIPHQGNRDLMFNWDNLFYACGHCNGIKLAKYPNILNCTKVDDDVENKIGYIIKEFPKFEVAITAIENDTRTTQTTVLLNAVFAGTTAEKRQEAAYIRERLQRELLTFRDLILQYRKNTNDSATKNNIKAHLDSSSAFTSFKRAIIKNNPELFAEFGAAL